MFMMKYLLLFSIATTIIETALAQTWDEWFKQNKTQKEYLVKQISALKLYASYVAKGIRVANDGLKAIKTFKSGDLDLHTTFFKASSIVNQNTRKYGESHAIFNTHAKILVLQRKARDKKVVEQLTSQEFAYIQKVFKDLVEASANNVDQMRLLLLDNNLQLKEDERIKKIDKISLDMEDKYLFARHFTSQLKLLAQSRVKEIRANEWIKVTYNLK